MGWYDTPKRTPSTKSGWGITRRSDEELARRQQTAGLERDALRAKEEEDDANSLVGLAGNTVLDLGHKLATVPSSYIKTVVDAMSNTGRALNDNQVTAVQEMKRALTDPKKSPLAKADASKDAVSKALFRSGGELIIGVTSPISAAIGEALRLTGGDKVVDDTGKVVADQTGITDIPAFQKYAMEHPNAGKDFEYLLNYLTLGFGGKAKVNPGEVRAVSETIATKLVDEQVPPGSRRVPVEGESVQRPVEFQNRYTPDNQLPTINAGPARRTPVEKKGSFTYEPVPGESVRSSWYSDDVTFVPETAPVRTATPARTTETPTAPRESVETAVRERQQIAEGEAINTRAQKLLETAVQKGIMDETGPIPTHQIKNMAEDLDRAFSLIKRDRDTALDIATKVDTDAIGVQKGSVYKALELEAIEKSDIATIMKLAKSDVPTEAGRALKALDSNDINSPVRIIRDINKTRSERVTKRSGEKVEATRTKSVREAKKEIKQAYSKRPTWEQFLDDLTCNI